MPSIPKIAYFGLPLGALFLADAGFRPASVCIGHPDTPGTRRLRRLLGPAGTLLLGRPDLGDNAVVRTLEASAPEVVVSWFWPKRIPSRVLSLASRGAFGVHPALLPRWRGPDPFFWSIDAGDSQTGVTLHRLTEHYDAGSIIAQRSIRIRADDDAWSLARRLDAPGLSLLVECARRLSAGEELLGTPQDDEQITQAPHPNEEVLSIDFTRRADEIARRVRAAAPRPGAVADLNGNVVTVLRAVKASAPPPRALRPAESIRTEAGLVVQTGDGRGVLIDRVYTADGTILAGRAVADLLS